MRKPAGTPGRTHCGKWVRADPAKHGTSRLVCNQPAQHSGGYHLAGASGWMWSTHTGRPRWSPQIVRRWVCRGWDPDRQMYCGHAWIGTEQAARVKGWKIEAWYGDQLCPQCGKPDPDTARLCRDLEKSIQR